MKNDQLFTEFPELLTERLHLLEYKQDYIGDVYKILSDERVSRFETREPFTKIAQAKRYVEVREFITREKSEGIIWAISTNLQNEIIGDIGYYPHHLHNAEIGFKLRYDFWNKGIMTEALEAVTQFLFTKTDTKRIEATTRPDNEAARRVLEKNDYIMEGIMRECEHHKDESFDLVMYSILKREYAP
jgi:ribosomal-protein-alanine N-acetyltransferase